MGNRKEVVIGEVYGKCTIIGYADDYITPSGYHHTKCLVRCSCGKEYTTSLSGLKTAAKKGNGMCFSCRNRQEVIIGEIYGQCTIIGRADDYINPKSGTVCTRCLVRCNCGKEYTIILACLKYSAKKGNGMCISCSNKISGKIGGKIGGKISGRIRSSSSRTKSFALYNAIVKATYTKLKCSCKTRGIELDLTPKEYDDFVYNHKLNNTLYCFYCEMNLYTPKDVCLEAEKKYNEALSKHNIGSIEEYDKLVKELKNLVCWSRKRNSPSLSIPKGQYLISLDRINSNEGYKLGNIQLVCCACNKAKLDMSHKEFIQHINKIAKIHPISEN